MNKTWLILSTWYNHPHLALPDHPELGECPHAQDAMKALGIEYDRCEPRSMTDSWHFYGCTNVPAKLPRWLRRYEMTDRE